MDRKILGVLALVLLLGGGAIGIFRVSAKDNTTSQITVERAKRIAETEVGGTISSVLTEQENGGLVYEIQVGDKEVEVDAQTGAILEIEKTDSSFEILDFDDRSK